MIKVENLTKRYGSKTVIDNLSFEVKPGTVTGFLGPNGAGKSTTMRLIMGLDAPAKGKITLNNSSIHKFSKPLNEVGALLDAGYVHPTRKAKFHLLSYAASNGISKKRVDQVLDLVGLREVANKRVGKFSLGMKQRIGIAYALLGDPKTLIFDEPANGLDPEGVHWIRNFLKGLASEGRTIFVSSHLLSEMSLMADELVIIGEGKLIRSTSVKDLMSEVTDKQVIVSSPNLIDLQNVLLNKNIACETKDGYIVASNVEVKDVGHIAFENQIEIHQLYQTQPSLEDIFLRITSSAQEYRTNPNAIGETND
ncbi:MAG: ATP-binding cassette domain-containing protein [Acidimicrobiia bacterium]